jgi:hypothetical protein
MKSAGVSELLSVFVEARRRLAAPDNDFSWSGWDTAEEALGEVDDVIARLEAGQMPAPLQMRVLFAPTGPIQEVSINSGWGDDFLELAAAFDAALSRAVDHDR